MFVYLIPIILAITGYLTAGLINYLADVLPRYRSFVQPTCEECGASQSLLEYWLVPWRYRECGHRRPLRHLVVTIGSIGAAFWMWYFPPEKLGGGVGYLLLVYFAIVTVIDIEHRLILHPVALTGAVLCGVIGYLRHGLVDTILGGVVGFGLMLGLYLLGGLFTRWLSRRRQEPVGGSGIRLRRCKPGRRYRLAVRLAGNSSWPGIGDIVGWGR